MTPDEKLMQQALEALEMWCPMTATYLNTRDQAIAALRERLAERCVCGEPDTPGTHRTDGPCLAEQPAQQPAQQQEPVACPYCRNSHTLGAVYFDQNCAGCVKRMTTPPRQWQGLTDEELQKIYEDHRPYIGSMITAVAAKLREKNT